MAGLMSSKRIAVGVFLGFLCASVLLAISTASATGTDGPIITPAPDEAVVALSAPILGPAPPPGWVPFSLTGAVTFLRTDPIEGLDKGSILTDLGVGLAPAAPNALEQIKLEMARRAIEASQAAGTLLVDPPLAVETGVGAEIEKSDAVLETPANPPTSDPAACVGDFPSLQLPGPGELSPAELGKLQAIPRATAGDASQAKEGN
jgi:hypothetical protein